MAKHPPLNRSISMSQIPKRSASINSQANQSPINNLKIGNVMQKSMDKGYKFLTKIMFTNRVIKKGLISEFAFQNEHAKKFDKSTGLLHLLAFFGISWLTARKLAKWTVVSVAFYNLSVFLSE